MATICQYIETTTFCSVTAPNDGDNLCIVARDTEQRIVAEIVLTREESQVLLKNLKKLLGEAGEGSGEGYEDYEEKLEDQGNKRIGAVAMNARLKKDTPAPPRKSRSDIPNPGSDDAMKIHCTCPHMDNNYGKGIMGDGGLFWINQTCPVHGAESNRSLGRKLTK